MSARPPVRIDAAFEAEARAMVQAMQTGELPPEDAPWYGRVKGYADLHWAENERRRAANGGRS
jgi:hypothetical protein